MNQTVLNNDSATFAVVASSGTTMWYQWFKDGGTIIGATSSYFTIAQAQTTNQGVYSVKVSNAAGSVVSSNATLTVLGPTQFTTQPQSQTVTQGRLASFWVAASGAGPITYQWALNGLPLPGATGSALVFSNAQPFNAGTYTALATSLGGSATSAPAALTVLPSTPPSFTATEMNSAGFKLQLSVASGFTYIISASSNLQDWTPISTNSALTTSMTITDTGATNHPRRFYRAAARLH